MVFTLSSEGARLSEYRKSKGISQVEMAKKLKCSQPNLNKIEKGVVGISANIRNNLFESYPDLNPTWLSNGQGRMLLEGSRLPNLRSNDTESSVLMSAENFIAQLSEARKLFLDGKIPPATMALLLEDIKKIMELQKERIDELQKDKDFLKQLIVSSKDGAF